MPEWRNGRRSGLKIRFRKECGFDSRFGHVDGAWNPHGRDGARPSPFGSGIVRAGRFGREGLCSVRLRGFTLIEVLASMAVLLILTLALTRMFVSATDITKRGMTSIARNSVGETAMETICRTWTAWW